MAHKRGEPGAKGKMAGGLKGFIAVRIRQARMQAGLSREQLGKLLGLTDVSIGNIERGMTDVDAPTLMRVSKILGKPVAWFIDENFEDVYRTPGVLISELQQKIKAYIPVYAELVEGKYTPVVDSIPVLAIGADIANLKAYRIAGLNCDPIIRDGDTLIVDISIEPEQGDIVIFKHREYTLCGMYNMANEGQFEINTPTQSWPVGECRLFGVVIEMHRRLK